jgi:hypothetical protein
MDATQLRAALATIHARWEHGHDGLSVHCALCAAERAELAALTAVSRALRPAYAYPAGQPSYWSV